jgi:hypothetical protein
MKSFSSEQSNKENFRRHVSLCPILKTITVHIYSTFFNVLYRPFHHQKNLLPAKLSSVYYQRTTEFYKNKLSMIKYENVKSKKQDNV